MSSYEDPKLSQTVNQILLILYMRDEGIQLIGRFGCSMLNHYSLAL
jgi:hypothetical protein